MGWYGELTPRILPRPTSAPAGDKPPHYISPSPPLWIPAFAGMTNGGPERQVEESWSAGTIEAA